MLPPECALEGKNTDSEEGESVKEFPRLHEACISTWSPGPASVQRYWEPQKRTWKRSSKKQLRALNKTESSF